MIVVARKMLEEAMAPGYWQRAMSRRRLLKVGTTAGASLVGLSFLSCGGGSSNSTGTGAKLQGLIVTPEDTTKQAKRGGIYQSVVPNDETNLDPFTTTRGAGSGGVEVAAYQKLLREKESIGSVKTQTFEGDAAESYELSADGLQLTAKLRPNNKFDPRPPTNSRALTAQDVVFSWQKLLAGSTYASVLSNEKDPGAPIQSVQATDNLTVVYKMAFPW